MPRHAGQLTRCTDVQGLSVRPLTNTLRERERGKLSADGVYIHLNFCSRNCIVITSILQTVSFLLSLFLFFPFSFFSFHLRCCRSHSLPSPTTTAKTPQEQQNVDLLFSLFVWFFLLQSWAEKELCEELMEEFNTISIVYHCPSSSFLSVASIPFGGRFDQDKKQTTQRSYGQDTEEEPEEEEDEEEEDLLPHANHRPSPSGRSSSRQETSRAKTKKQPRAGGSLHASPTEGEQDDRPRAQEEEEEDEEAGAGGGEGRFAFEAREESPGRHRVFETKGKAQPASHFDFLSSPPSSFSREKQTDRQLEGSLFEMDAGRRRSPRDREARGSSERPDGTAGDDEEDEEENKKPSLQEEEDKKKNRKRTEGAREQAALPPGRTPRAFSSISVSISLSIHLSVHLHLCYLSLSL